MPIDRVEFLGVEFDKLSEHQVIDRLSLVTAETPFGYIVTPNVDHVVRLNGEGSEPALGAAYANADLCLCDSRVLALLARFRRIRLPVVTGSDLTAALLEKALTRGDRVAIVGGSSELMRRLSGRYSHIEFVHHCPPMGLRRDVAAQTAAAAFIAQAKCRFTFLAVGSPQQELIAARVSGGTGFGLCIGAALEFLTGDQVRAPKALRRTGLEWAYRLASDPRRLWRRYLIEGPQVFLLAWRWRASRGRRTPGMKMIRSALWRDLGSNLRRAALPLAVAMLLLLIGLIGAQLHSARPDQSSAERAVGASLPEALAQPNAFRPLTVEQAIEANRKLPFAQRRDDAAREFVLKIDGDDRGRAVECLAQAAYYEAASEGADGQRAVAQVVLNRLRHPGYPSSICGVVYQGSERVMGCQFTFTCDGSLLRRPNVAMFASARKIAIEALAGHVFAPVGHATNYHADYVLPYWAASLDKQIQVGRHIFYRLKGNLGSSSAFGQRHAGREPTVVPQRTIILSGEALAQSDEVLATELPGSVTEDRLSNPMIVADAVIREPLAADNRSGVLMIGDATPGAPKKKVMPTKDCPLKDSTRILPTAPNELRSDTKDVC